MNYDSTRLCKRAGDSTSKLAEPRRVVSLSAEGLVEWMRSDLATLA